MRNLLLTVEYDGTCFSGWQRQPSVRTVQGELERVLSLLCKAPISINGTSRTDAGVHAYGQRASFCGDFGIPTDRMLIAANHLLCGGKSSASDVRITEIQEKEEGFHARFSAKGKTYCYKIINDEIQDVFQKNYAYQVMKPLNVQLMEEVAEKILGTHDFKCFQAAGGKELLSTERTIRDIRIEEHPLETDPFRLKRSTGKSIVVQVTGDGFLYNMVRILVGTLVEVGHGKIPVSAMEEILKGKDRRKAGHTAPPQGLYLAQIYYDWSEFDDRIHRRT